MGATDASQHSELSDEQSPDAAHIAQELDSIQFLRLNFSLEAVQPIVLPPYTGSALRGGFGVAFYHAVCVSEDTSCFSCDLKHRCAYPYVFDTPVPPDSTRMRRYTSAPHPFVIEPPPGGRTYEPGDALTFGLVLIGGACELLPYFIRAFEVLGFRYGLGKGRGKFRLKEVRWVSSLGPRQSPPAIPADSCYPRPVEVEGGITTTVEFPIYSADACRIAPIPRLERLSQIYPFAEGQDDSQGTAVTVKFLTPCRLVSGGKLADRVDFSALVASALRRFSNLAYFHCGRELQLPFKQLVEISRQVTMIDSQLEWTDWRRFSARQQTHMLLGGIVGQATYISPKGFAVLMPLLNLASILHVGKATSFGLGKIEVEVQK